MCMLTRGQKLKLINLLLLSFSLIHRCHNEVSPLALCQLSMADGRYSHGRKRRVWFVVVSAQSMRDSWLCLSSASSIYYCNLLANCSHTVHRKTFDDKTIDSEKTVTTNTPEWAPFHRTRCQILCLVPADILNIVPIKPTPTVVRDNVSVY